jgi:hypothetical protein
MAGAHGRVKPLISWLGSKIKREKENREEETRVPQSFSMAHSMTSNQNLPLSPTS